MFGKYSSDESYLCVPISANIIFSMMVSKRVHRRTNASVEAMFAVSYGSGGKGLVHVKPSYMLQPTNDFRIPHEFPVESPETLSCHDITHSR